MQNISVHGQGTMAESGAAWGSYGIAWHGYTKLVVGKLVRAVQPAQPSKPRRSVVRYKLRSQRRHSALA